jgi:hypothetical protein
VWSTGRSANAPCVLDFIKAAPIEVAQDSSRFPAAHIKKGGLAALLINWKERSRIYSTGINIEVERFDKEASA